MTYAELNDRFVRAWADEKGIIRGAPCMAIYTMKMAAGAAGMEAIVDEDLLVATLVKAGLVLPGVN